MFHVLSSYTVLFIIIIIIIIEQDTEELIVNPNTMEDEDSLDLMSDIGAGNSEKTNATTENTAAVSAAAGKSLHMVCLIQVYI